MAALETLTRERVKEIVEDEFSAEGFAVTDDKLTRAAGRNGAAELACYPDVAEEDARNTTHLVTRVVLQMYLAYTAEPDETIAVDPSVIEGYAERLRNAFQAQSQGTGGDLWYLRLVRVSYPDDPTGNRSRLEAEITGHGQNTAGTPIGN